MMACYEGHIEIVKLLLEYGADPLQKAAVRKIKIALSN